MTTANFHSFLQFTSLPMKKAVRTQGKRYISNFFFFLGRTLRSFYSFELLLLYLYPFPLFFVREDAFNC